jgi:ribosomal protein L37AE/L43A
LVVVEELVHMRDFLDGDRRRHAKHGHDRIAVRVANLTGASLDEIRNCLIPASRRPVRYHYACPACGMTVGRRCRGIWSCGRCSNTFDWRFVLQLVHEVGTIHASERAVAEREGEATCSN